jgi:hypothetical protein
MELKEGDFVWMKRNVGNKLEPRYQGPAKILKILGPSNVQLEFGNDIFIRNHESLKPFVASN